MILFMIMFLSIFSLFLRFSFVEKVCNNSKHLDLVSGLQDLRATMEKVNLDDMIALGTSDEDDF